MDLYPFGLDVTAPVAAGAPGGGKGGGGAREAVAADLSGWETSRSSLRRS